MDLSGLGAAVAGHVFVPPTRRHLSADRIGFATAARWVLGGLYVLNNPQAKPCDKCGADALVEFTPIDPARMRPGCGGEHSVCCGGDCKPSWAFGRTREEAIANWNRN